MKNTYTQCRLEKSFNGNGLMTTTTFLPSKFAVMGGVVKLRNEDGDWDDGWVVKSVGATVNEDFLPDSHKAIKEHRKKTGDSLKKT